MCLLAIGCNSDPNCRRETALLRSEILDLEDKYYLLKSERDALAQGQGFVESQIYAESQPISGSPIPIDSQFLGHETYGHPSYHQPYHQDVAHDESVVYDQGVVYDDGVIHDDGLGYDQGTAYVDGQGYYVDTGEPYYGEPAYAVDAYGPGDPDIIYENDSRFQGGLPHGFPGTLSSAHHGEIVDGAIYGGQPPMVQSEVKLAPDDSILPLYSDDETGEMESDSYIEDFDLEVDLDLLPEAPRDTKVGFALGRNKNVQEVTEIVINRLATRGHDIDGIPGDEGLDLLIQPRSADGQIQLIAGELTVSVIDPTQVTAQQRIGLWKFVESETELFFANNELGSYGILLHLPWDQETPVSKKLTIHVRFIPSGGKTFETAAEIRIDPPQPDYSPDAPMVTGWTRSDKRWNSELGSSIKRRRSSGSSGSDWVRRRDPSPIGAQVTTTNEPPQLQIPRRRIEAIPAKATINTPTWRPTR